MNDQQEQELLDRLGKKAQLASAGHSIVTAIGVPQQLCGASLSRVGMLISVDLAQNQACYLSATNTPGATSLSNFAIIEGGGDSSQEFLLSDWGEIVRGPVWVNTTAIANVAVIEVEAV